MVKHIVMFKLAEKNPENLDQAVAALNSLRGNIETLKFIEIGADFLSSERSYDIVLTTEFDNREGLKIYTLHPNHLKVVKVIRSTCSASVVVDYEF